MWIILPTYHPSLGRQETVIVVYIRFIDIFMMCYIQMEHWVCVLRSHILRPAVLYIEMLCIKVDLLCLLLI